MRFDDHDYIAAYRNQGIFPRIHDDIFNTAKHIHINTAIDIGCCFGLLSARLAGICNKVIGIDPNKGYLSNAIKHEKVSYYQLAIEKSSLDRFKNLLQNNRVDTVVARRVIPEIYDTGGFELVEAFTKAMYDSNVQYIVLEGRKSNRNAVNPLPNADKEVQALTRYFQQVYSYKNCRILKRGRQ